MKLYEINDLISSVCPVYGINSDGAINFRPESTDEQKVLAKEIMAEKLPLLDESNG